MSPTLAAEIAAAQGEIADAADAILSAAEKGQASLAAARAGEAGALAELDALFAALIEACAFQDLVGQRLAKIGAQAGRLVAPATDGLLNGPAVPGAGLDQGAADALMAVGDEAWPRP